VIRLLLNAIFLAGFPALVSASLSVTGVSPFHYRSRLAGAANPLGQKKAYGYDKLSRVTEVKDPAGNITAYAYDALNRLTRREVRPTSGEGAVTDYSYDAVGNLLKIASGDSAVAYTYDALDRPVETKQTFAGKTYAIAYAYDAVGNRTAMKTPWGDFSYTYDALNRLTGLVNPQGITVAFKYDAAGRRVKKTIFKTAPSLLAETDYAYDAAGQLLSIVNKAGGRVAAFNNYEYDLAGNRVRIEDKSGLTKYGYDKSNRLITVEPVPHYIPGEEAFIYDKNGNRRFDKGAKDYKYDAANRLQHNSAYTYTHDQNGNLTARTHKASTTTVTYAYNLEQQLAEVAAPEHKVQYKYDPLGRRIERTVDGSHTLYVYDNEDIIAMLDGNGGLLQTFTHGPGIDEPLIMTKSDGANYYYHADGLGSITALTDDNAQTVETYTYKAYGQPTIKSAKGAELASSAIGNPYLFTARELDIESGLYYYRARYYDWLRGAFTQEDPIAFSGQNTNLYGYVGLNPMSFADPYGLIRYNHPSPQTVPVTGQTEKSLTCVEKCLQKKSGNPKLDLLITGGAEKMGHSKKSSHYTGEACDIAGPAFNKVQTNNVMSCAASCGFRAGQYESFPNSVRNHWHLQLTPRNGVPALPVPADMTIWERIRGLVRNLW